MQLDNIVKNLFQKVAANCEQTIVLTPNLRLSRSLHQQFDQYQQTIAGKTLWLTPSIMPLSVWLSSWWNLQNTSLFLLNDEQEHAIWSEIIRHSLTEQQVNSEIVDSAKEAWTLLNKWNIPLESLKNNSSDDIALFYSWAQEFKKTLHLKKCCVSSDIITLFLNTDSLHNSHNLVNLPQKIILLGFEDLSISPQEQTFFATLNNQLNCKVERFDPNTKSSIQQKVLFLEQKSEILNMALWAHKLWQKNPTQEIGCIVPNLTNIKTQVQRIFKEVFATPPHSFPPFNISVGESLNHYPMINSGLQIIELFFQMNDFNALATLLNSPFIAETETELHYRAALINKCKEYYQYQFDLNHFLVEAKKSCPIFSKILQTYLKNFVHLPKYNLPSKWIEIFAEQLQTFGWLKGYSLNTAEYQTLQCWQQVLKEFASLDFVLPKLSHQNAIKYLNSFTKKTIFQPKTPSSSINVLGSLEAAGLNFDHIWIMAMNQHIFPPATKPNPFLPINLQRKLNLPNSSAERETRFCSALIARFAHSTDHIIYSYAQKEEEQDLRISPLITQIAEIKSTELGLAAQPTIAQKIHATSKLEQFIDNTAPPLLVDEKITGGSKILEQQALCPFAAFAAYRLHAATAGKGSLKTTRGILIHETLKQIWRLIKNKGNLQHLSAQELQAIIIQHLEQSIIDLKKSQKMLLHDAHLELEKKCLISLLTDWLQKECENYGQLFFEVIDTEKEIEFSIEKITLKLRIDRIDQIEDGGLVIVDYKTGKTKPKSPMSHWSDERPTNIQLPLYCLAIEENLVGLIFAQIHVANLSNKKHLQGWIADEKLKKSEHKNSTLLSVKTAEEWQKIKNEWHINLSNLAKEFCQGLALVSPKNPRETCEYCEFEILCRIHTLKTE